MQNTISQGPIRIGILANEVSGDQLAAALIEALRSKQPDILFEGMTGSLMEAAGCCSLARMDPVMGIVEVFRHLPGLLKTRRRLADHFLNSPPDLVLGVDAPDFNLALETRFKAAGILTAHFVSPTVWAWRQGRVKKLQQAVDLMLCIFDFEVDFLRQHKVPAVYVGHPMADQIPLEPVDARRVKTQLGLDPDRPVIALLPGSRMSEVSRLGLIFLQAALWLGQQKPGLQFVAPMVNEKIKKAFQDQLHAVAPNLSLLLLDGQSRQAISAADVVLTASGTATLETLLFKRPMVIAYRLSTVTMRLIRTFNMLKIRYVAIANLLADRPYATEFLQEACEPEAMGRALLNFLDNRPQREEIEQVYLAIHQRLRRNAANSAAEEILGMLDIR
ncbi:MAG: lipid-A-disaccharide synthase [Candidatus Thiodiazotropha sp. (ex Lucinoma aequizonata)]|nr:lipid-A-disaccharide synthase [Candidatus Thiodiazotropha sp. (ex Lucinoma aequizonata)]MCU7887270.1 lipid-A-disaccharide synthase [Candidatus Thiodiazotropha sp. (ex Lucinoma aequizonata)]MCU7894123.1 lipid-A-disaccharide synthase [Candidatus Thiodiazotropha sp. (ex Lucinoma aequizonata)]MCU7898033.1 lipid-A-disaccharide synthase [Candidatus Thiodiazotropha sp. (ex Lucinoma aequizonata)]MCU7903079.1 lipid-A-disaccharide synthase [Candidatus Thiodiazotropha sp. (ex Lucinoma aequizonata)]